MANHTVRNSIRTIADLANQAPHLAKMVNYIGEERRRRQRASSTARQAGLVGAGLVLGAGLVALFTPTSGAQTRRRLSDQAMRIRDYVAPKANGAARSAERAAKKELS